ncbi:DUF2975 domain-containing protein [Terrisporobacter glycolicus]|uniref:DUF2975 domain-containing protein n=1 Tax=Terrisporobacter glycolicus TaxID=36841 RepID=UPI000CDEE4B2
MNTSYKILSTLLVLCMIITGVILFSLPSIIDAAFKGTTLLQLSNPNIVTGVTIGTYICSVPFVIALFLLKRLGKSLSSENQLIKKVSSIFKGISICAFIEFCLINIITFIIAFLYIHDKNAFFSIIAESGIISISLLVVGFVCVLLSNFFNKVIELNNATI